MDDKEVCVCVPTCYRFNPQRTMGNNKKQSIIFDIPDAIYIPTALYSLFSFFSEI